MYGLYGILEMYYSPQFWLRFAYIHAFDVLHLYQLRSYYVPPQNLYFGLKCLILGWDFQVYQNILSEKEVNIKYKKVLTKDSKMFKELDIDCDQDKDCSICL